MSEAKITNELLLKMSETDRVKALELLSELERREYKEKAQNNFMDFVNAVWHDFIPGNHHKKMAEAFERVARGELKRLIINMPPRHALTLDTLIPTTHGMKTMRDISVGDKVFHVSGKPITVVGKSEVFHDREIYKVTTDDGRETLCDGEHLWTVRLDRKRDIYHTHTTENLWKRQQGWFLRTKRGGGLELKPPSDTWSKSSYEPVRLPTLPAYGAAQYTTKELLIDPYVLGLWLGDGTSLQAIITSHDDDAQYVRPEIEHRGYITSDHATKYTFGILGLKVQLRELNLLGNKHIPQIYLESSEQQRRDLLKGLMDSDGNVSKKGQCFFSQKSQVFVEQVRTLLASLGIKSTIIASEAKIGDVSHGIQYQCSFYANDIAFLPRKEERTLKTERTFGRYIKIEKLDYTANTQCIKVDSEDGLFLIGEGYVCTHNTKSEFASYLLPAWWLGKFPKDQIMQVSHTTELAENFGRKVRNLVDSDDYKQIFDTRLSKDSTSAGRWNTSAKGVYIALGVGSALAGRGASICIIDDPISEVEGKGLNPAPHNTVWDWYMSGPRQRLQPGGSLIVVQTRWSKVDLTGRLVDNMIKNPDGDQWEVIEFPAIMPSGKPLWEAFWKLEELLRIKATIDTRFWNAQYMQNPTSEEGAIIKREWWRIWDRPSPPQTEFILMSWDTAYEKHNRADYSAMTVWGVFYHEDEETGVTQANIMLLDVVKKRVEFPELKQWVYDAYNEWQPDSMIVEKRASGASLIQELRRMGIPTQEFTPGKGNDKISRLTAVADIFASGFVWCPDTRWAQELMDEVASFPAGQHDDTVDCTSLALNLFRQGGHIRTRLDEPEEENTYRRPKREYY